MKPTRFSTCLLAVLATVTAYPVHAANILWVSDASPGSATGGVFSGPGTGYTDSAFVALLQNAGHNVNRFNSADAQAVLLTDAELTAINTNDLVIIGRATGSGAFRVGAGTGGGPGQGSNWNTRVTVPLICMSQYLVRTIVDNRMGWFAGDVGPDDTPTTLVAVNPTDPAVDFLFGGVAMNGNATAEVFDELMDRNTSTILGAPVVGGRVLATSTFSRDDNGATATGNMIADWPAGTVVAGGSNILAGYRMSLAGGTRESGTAPNAIPLYTGRENLTRTGEAIFLRAVRLALNRGVAPSDPAEPMSITVQPASITGSLGYPVTFTVLASGAAPRTLQWQRDVGDGVTFTNIPGASTAFSGSSLTLNPVSGVTIEDDKAAFRVVASNPNNSVTSDVAVLTVPPDTTGPSIVSVGSVDGTKVAIRFSEKVRDLNGAVTDEFSYQVNGSGETVSNVILDLDERTVILELSTAITGAFSVAVVPEAEVVDYFGNAMPAEGRQAAGMVVGLTQTAIGPINPALPTTMSIASNSVQITAGGFDLVSTGDIFTFVWRDVTGDFDARVRVRSLVAFDRIEAVSKAILSAREAVSLMTNPPAVNVFATAPYPGDDLIGSSVRTVTGGATNAMGPSFSPTGMPNTWLRLTRIGSMMTTFRSTDGTAWTTIGSVNAAFSQSLQVGLGVASHRNGRSVTANFDHFQVTRIVPAPTLTNPVFNTGVFSASFSTVAGATYRVHYKNSLTDADWSLLTSIPGDGSVLSFNDPGPLSPSGSRFYRLSVE